MFQKYLQLKFLEAPTLYTANMPQEERERIVAELRNELRQRVATVGYSNIRPGMLLKCSYFPEVLEDFVYTLPETSPLISGIVTANMDVALRLLVSKYDTPMGESIELLLLSHPEAILELFEWSAANKHPLRYSMDVYLPSIYKDISSAWRYFQRFEPIDKDTFFATLGEAYRLNSLDVAPQGGLLRLLRDNNTTKANLRAIALHPKTAIAAAYLLEKPKLVGEWMDFPKWAYHILKFLHPILTPEDKEHCIHAMVRVLPWMYQAVEDTNLKTTSPELYNKYLNVATTKWINIIRD